MHHPISPLPSINGLRLLWLLSVVLAFFYNIGTVPLFDLDEGAFSQATREMFLRDDFLTTYLNGEPRYDKPILIYWLQALSVKVFGTTEMAFRLPSAIAASLWSLSIVAFTWSISTPRNAFIAGILMTGALGVGVIGKAATADALLNLCLSGTMFTLYLYLVKIKLRYLLAAAFFAGLGFITKGPVAVIIPAVVSLLFSLWSGRFEQWLRMATNPLAWLIFVAVGLPWYIVHYLREGSAFLDNFIGTHNIGRFSNEMEGHGGAWWYYLPAILLIAFPFGFLILQPLYRIKTVIESDIGRYLLIWFLFVFILFSFSATKLPHYMLYGLTPLIVLTALNLPEKPHLKSVYIPVFLFIILLIALPFSIGFLLPDIKDTQLRTALVETFGKLNSSYLLLLVLTLCASVWLFLNKRWPHQGRLLSAGLVSTFVISAFFLPLIADIKQEPIKQAGIFAADYDAPAVIWRLNTPSFSVYSNKIAPRRKPATGELVLTKSHYLDELPGHEILFEQNGIALALVITKEVSDVPDITTNLEPSLLLVNSSPGADVGDSDSPVSDESVTLSSDQFAGDDDHRPGTMGNNNHPRGWAGGDRTAAAVTQEIPKVNHNSLGLGHSGSSDGTFFEGSLSGTKTTRGHRYTYDYRTWPGIQKRQFSIRPHFNPVRTPRMHGFLDERGTVAKPVPFSPAARFTGSPVAKCCRHPLAAGYHDRHGNRLAISNSRKSTHANYNHRRYDKGLGWPIPYPMHTLPPPCLRYGLYQCQGVAARYSHYCARIGVHGKFKNDQACIEPIAFLKYRGE
jgi:4-amino-4-deoxy-L-arabinose transferase-like glycosyltransferase